jgi:hypothetical protein
MLSRLPVVLGLASLAMLPALTLSGCSSSQKRDQFFGTDAGTDFQIPDAAGFSSQPTVEAGTAEAGIAEAGIAEAGAADVAPDTGLEDLPADASAQESGSDIDF